LKLQQGRVDVGELPKADHGPNVAKLDGLGKDASTEALG